MNTFLLYDGKKPNVKWGNTQDEIYFEGEFPQGFSLAVNPSFPYVIIDVDKHGKKDGFDFLPKVLEKELESTFSYNTKNNGKHFWFKYTGDKHLMNKTSGLGIDLRTDKGYVVYYPKNDIRKQMHLVKDTSELMNLWLENLFTNKIKIPK